MYNFDGFAPERYYFSAANSHNGFKNIFSQIFNPDRFERIYIIKGGSGTGKSSLMKAIGAFAQRRGYSTEAICCSSDPSSLDGIIIKYRQARIALLDGTAPHMTDPVYPGAVEEIINLGENFNIEYLRRKKNEIISLSKAKSVAYKNGYSSLKAAGYIYRRIYEVFSNSEMYNEAERIINRIFRSCENDDITENCQKIYESSFSKFGYGILPGVYNDGKTIRVGGNHLIAGFILKKLSDKLIEKKIATVICPSPLDEMSVDRIYTSDHVIEYSPDSAEILAPDITIEELSELAIIYQKLLDIAATHFAIAAENHFKIEDIYKVGMDFSGNERIYDHLIKTIQDLFSR